MVSAGVRRVSAGVRRVSAGFSPRASERIIFRAAGKITRFKAHGLKPVRTDGGYLAGPALLGEKYPMR